MARTPSPLSMALPNPSSLSLARKPLALAAAITPKLNPAKLQHAAITEDAAGAMDSPGLLAFSTSSPSEVYDRPTPLIKPTPFPRTALPATPPTRTGARSHSHGGAAPMPYFPQSWNTPMQQMSGLPFDLALHAPLAESSPFLDDTISLMDALNFAEEANKVAAMALASTPQPAGVPVCMDWRGQHVICPLVC